MSKNDNNALTRMLTEGTLSRRGLMKMLSAGAVMSSGIIGFPQLGFAAETPVKIKISKRCLRWRRRSTPATASPGRSSCAAA